MALKADSNRIRTVFGDHAKGKIEKIKQDRSIFAASFFRDRNGNPWIPREYQLDSLNSKAFRKVHCDGRDVGKTSEIEIVTLFTALLCPNTEIMIAAPCANHLIPTMERILWRLKEIEDFRSSVIKITRSPSYRIVLKTPAIIWGKIAGPRGINFQNTHVDMIFVDEAQGMPEAAWEEMYPALNARGRRWVYGVPNGIRNTFYRMTTMEEFEQYRWPSRINPEFDDARDEELKKLYGGAESPGYIHNVLGEHGRPAYGVFDPDAYDACYDGKTPFADIKLSGSDLAGGSLNNKLPLRSMFPDGEYYLGCDLGYTADPSEFTGWVIANKQMKSVFRINLTHVRYDVQQELILRLHERFGFSGIGIDMGGNGAAVLHNIIAARPEMDGVIEGYQFGEKIKLPSGQAEGEDKRPIKQFMTELLIKGLESGTLALGNCPDRESQYLSHTYHLGMKDQVIYDKGNDHIIDADRCAVLRRYRRENPSAPAMIPHLGLISGLHHRGDSEQ